MSDDPAADIRAAALREAQARARMTQTLREVRARLAPGALAREGARKVADAGQSAARNGADAARRNAAGLAGAIALGALFLARHRIAALFRRKPKRAIPAPFRSRFSSKDQSHD